MTDASGSEADSRRWRCQRLEHTKANSYLILGVI